MSHRHILSPATIFAVVLAATVTCSVPVFADTFGSGENIFEIEFVTIGHLGNSPDTEGWPDAAGSVPYAYRIGKYEISEQMINAANAATAGAGNSLEITIDDRGPNKPATSVDWIEAAQFVNWLNTSTGHAPAYKFEDTTGVQPPPPLDGFTLWEPGDAGYDPANLYRNRLARYVLPGVDEWYKAAYYDPNTGEYFPFPNGRLDPPMPVASGTEPNTAVFMQDLATGPADIMQAGGLSPYGTMAQGGNALEWGETELDLLNDDPSVLARRLLRGGFWNSTSSTLSASASSSNMPWVERSDIGFRVVSVPEPKTCLLLVWGSFCLLASQRRTGCSKLRS